MRFPLVLSASLLWASSSFSANQDPGGNEIGNGGTVVVCQKGEGLGATQTVETLDVFESKRVRNLDVDFGHVGNDAMTMARHAINRLHFLDPRREARYLATLDQFEEEMLLLSDTTFPSTEDTDHFPLPSNCTLKQAVIQRIKRYPEDKKYYINESLWFKLDEPNRATMILHEIIYEETLKHGHVHSVAARYFNSQLFSGMIHKVSERAYAEMIDNMGLNRLRWVDQERDMVWELSMRGFAQPGEAAQFCKDLDMALLDRKDATPGRLQGLRRSFIGKYYIATTPGLLVWANDGEDMFTALQISMLYEKVRDPQLQRDLPALCQRQL